MNRTRDITEGVIWKQILEFFFPILLGTFFQQMYNTVDAIIVGRYIGTQALAAVGSTGSITSKREGDLSISYGSGATTSTAAIGDTDLAQSRWGLMLLALRKGCKPFMGVIRGGK